MKREKSNKLCLGMLVMVLALGMSVAGCDNNTTSNVDLFAGTWVANVLGSENRMVASNGNWRSYMGGNAEAIRGTYTLYGNNVTLRIVEVIPALVVAGANQWVGWAELDPIVREYLGGSPTTTGIITGNTFSTQGVSYIRQ